MNKERLWKLAVKHNILQKKKEFFDFLGILDTFLEVKENFLEIGCNHGGTSIVFGEIFKRGYAIDMDVYPEYTGKYTQIIADSHDINTKITIEKIGLQFDLLFIDGDHSLEGVMKDFIFYEPFVKPGGLIVLHDIVPDNEFIFNQVINVKPLWEFLKYFYPNYWEIVYQDDYSYCPEILKDIDMDSWGGIGIVRKEK